MCKKLSFWRREKIFLLLFTSKSKWRTESHKNHRIASTYSQLLMIGRKTTRKGGPAFTYQYRKYYYYVRFKGTMVSNRYKSRKRYHQKKFSLNQLIRGETQKKRYTLYKQDYVHPCKCLQYDNQRLNLKSAKLLKSSG